LAAGHDRRRALSRSFAGTGRSVRSVVTRSGWRAWFIEQDARLIDGLQRRSEHVSRHASIVRRDAFAFLREQPSTRFDIVFWTRHTQPLEPLLAFCRRGLRQPRCLRRAARSEGLPTVAAAEWVKRSHAGAVEYGLLRFDRVTMPASPEEPPPK
jgi:hypothetical protein